MFTDGVSYEAMLENERNEFKLYTMTDSRIIPVLRYVPLDPTGELIGNPGRGFYRPIEYEVRLGEDSGLEIVGPIRLNERQIMLQRYVTQATMIRILNNLSLSSTIVVGTLP